MQGIGTVLAWFNRQLKVMPLGDIAGAVQYLGLSPTEDRRVREILETLERELGEDQARER